MRTIVQHGGGRNKTFTALFMNFQCYGLLHFLFSASGKDFMGNAFAVPVQRICKIPAVATSQKRVTPNEDHFSGSVPPPVIRSLLQQICPPETVGDNEAWTKEPTTPGSHAKSLNPIHGLKSSHTQLHPAMPSQGVMPNHTQSGLIARISGAQKHYFGGIYMDTDEISGKIKQP